MGAAFAHSLALALGRPAVGIHHLEGHLLSPLLSRPAPAFPFVALLVSGGHTQLLRVDGVGRYRLLGETVDDAAGEAFDKTAALLGLEYPGGPALARLAIEGDPTRHAFPRPLLTSPGVDFSFSGLKTAVLQAVRGRDLTMGDKADVAASFQAAVVDVVCAKCVRAMESEALPRLVVAGGVGANEALRASLLKAASHRGGEVFFPPPRLCTDNGAMVAFAGALRHTSTSIPTTGFTVRPRWQLAGSAGSGQA